ncbi:glycine/sarcosine/betaine reductase selenoprotein B family protein [Metabacillus indicus]|uniref:glycine/sarcosine/betaine reductase selenoprotein B family protein n=1 Tax=Metabacillus indicus TaxID=246786 RepID=UPI003CED23D2
MSEKIRKLEDFVREKWVPDFKLVKNQDVPWTSFSKKLNKAKITIISTGGVYVKGETPFTDHYGLGDPSYREISSNTPIDRLGHFHEHYNHKNADEDINCIFPIERVKQLVEKGFIGGLTEYHYSFMGYIPIPHPLINRTGPDLAKKLLLQQTDAVLLVPT